MSEQLKPDHMFCYLPGAVSRLCVHTGRILLASLFILGGLNKIIDPATSIGMIETAGLPVPGLLIYAVIPVELGLGLVVAAGNWLHAGRWVAPACAVLVLYTLAINIQLHALWSFEGETARRELSLFFKNVSVAGGLTLLAGLYGSPKGNRGGACQT